MAIVLSIIQIASIKAYIWKCNFFFFKKSLKLDQALRSQ